MMVARLRTRLVFGAGFCLVGAGLTRAQQQDTLDSARKDLEELPASVASPNAPAKSLDTGKLDLVIPSSGTTTSTASTAPSSTDASSQGWLLDALTKNTATGSSDRDGLAPTNRGSSSRQQKLDTTVSAETVRAWTPFLQSWLLPQNRSLVPTGSVSATGQKDLFATRSNSFVPDRAATDASNRSTPSGWLTGDATYHDPLAQRANPYLDNKDAQIAGPSDFRMPKLTATSLTNTLSQKSSESSDADENLYPITGDTKPNARSAESIAPPTAAVVNQQKYFPQLDRF